MTTPESAGRPWPVHAVNAALVCEDVDWAASLRRNSRLAQADSAARVPKDRHRQWVRSMFGWGALLAVVAMCGVVLAACRSGPSHARRAASNLDAVAAGRQIFRDGTDRAGKEIPRRGGTGTMMMMMGNRGCSSCHGTDGRGGSNPAVQAPDITYANLTDPKGMQEVDGSRGMVYTAPLLRRAITEGVGADGKLLSSEMPRWQLTKQQWSDLLAYLRTLR